MPVAAEGTLTAKKHPSDHFLAFDSGIKASTAYIASASEQRGHVQETSLSDEETVISDPTSFTSTEEQADKRLKAHSDQGTFQARTLYDFKGKPEFGELTVQAGVDLVVLKSDVGDGWSLVDCIGQVGLVPTNYYALTTSFVGPATADTATEYSIRSSPLEPQLTGSYFPNFRKSLLGRKSNRFASFVTSGAEDWILRGSQTSSTSSSGSSTADDSSHTDGTSKENKRDINKKNKNDHHIIDSGPSWREKVPPFRVLVHSPYKHKPTLSAPYTLYQVTSVFSSTSPELAASSLSNDSVTRRVTVHRRFSHFISLHTVLIRKLPGIALPPLPGKQYTGRFNNEFIESRRSDLERYMSRLIRHPVVRYAEILMKFLSCENDIEWRRYSTKAMDAPVVGASFYAHVYHPSYSLELDECGELSERFARHLGAVEGSMQHLRDVFARLRASRAEEASSHRLLAYSLLGLIASKSVDVSRPNLVDFNEAYNSDVGSAPENQPIGSLNNQNAWCWRDDCEDCLGLSMAYQGMAENLQYISSINERSAYQKQFVIHEQLKDCSHPLSMYESVLDVHRGAFLHYKGSNHGVVLEDEVVARSETVLNVTASEMDVYHTQKFEDFRRIAEDYLDEEIAVHQKILERLKAARSNFDETELKALAGAGIRHPSIFEKDLGNSKVVFPEVSLPQPCPHVFDATPMRPVSAAVQEGVGMILGQPNSLRINTGRGSSVLSRFW